MARFLPMLSCSAQLQLTVCDMAKYAHRTAAQYPSLMQVAE